MGEYARIQMAKDAARLFGGEWDEEDFAEPPPKKKPKCPVCGRTFRTHLALGQHMRDKQHAAKEQKP